MTPGEKHILSYATPTGRPKRFGHLKAIIPFTLGLLLGGIGLITIGTSAPKLADPDGSILMIVPICIAATAAYASTILLMIGCFSTQPRPQLRPKTCGLLGIGLPLVAAGIALFATETCVIFPVPPWLGYSAAFVVFVIIAAMIIAAPFLLVQWEAPAPPQIESPRWMPSSAKIGLGVVGSLFVLFGIGIAATRTPLVKITSPEIPFSSSYEMKNGDAVRYELPSGKVVSVWCERQGGSLTTSWGERPFTRPPLVEKMIDKNTSEAAGWDSYIKQGDVITYGESKTTEFVLYVDNLRFSIIDGQGATSLLPVTVKIIVGKEK